MKFSGVSLHYTFNKRHNTCYVCMHGGHSLRSDPRDSPLVNTQQLWQERKVIYHFQNIMTLHFRTGHVHRRWKMAPKPQALSKPSPLEINGRGTLMRCSRGVQGSSYRGQLTKRPLQTRAQLGDTAGRGTRASHASCHARAVIRTPCTPALTGSVSVCKRCMCANIPDAYKWCVVGLVFIGGNRDVVYSRSGCFSSLSFSILLIFLFFSPERAHLDYSPIPTWSEPRSPCV